MVVRFYSLEGIADGNCEDRDILATSGGTLREFSMEGGPVAGATLSDSPESRLARPTEAQFENQRVSREDAKLAKKKDLVLRYLCHYENPF